MAGRARHPPFRLMFYLIGLLASLIPATSRAQPPETVTVGLIIDADSPVGRIASTTIPMALDDFYAALPNSSTRVQILQHDSGGDVVAAASAGMDTCPPPPIRPHSVASVPDAGPSLACVQRCS
jgi:glutamate receptor, ionotropic, plant